MPSKEEVLRILVDLTRRVEAEEVDLDFSLEAYDYLFRADPTRRLASIENKVDQLLSRSEYGHCRLAGVSRSDTIELITGIVPNARAHAHGHLSKYLEGARHLTICDPYFLKSVRAVQSDVYVASVVSVLPQSLKALEVFAGKSKRDKSVADKLSVILRNKGIRVRCYKTDEIHDRVWIRDYGDAYSVGTSFNGLGDKCAFILPLPPDDVRAFMAKLSSLREDLPASKSL